MRGEEAQEAERQGQASQFAPITFRCVTLKGFNDSATVSSPGLGLGLVGRKTCILKDYRIPVSGTYPSKPYISI